MNMIQDRQTQNVGGNGGNQFGQYAGQVAQNQQGYNAWQNGRVQVAQNAVQNTGVQSGGNQNRLVVVPGIANQNGTGNVVAEMAEGTRIGNQARCYNCRGLGHIARNCTARPRRRDAAYLQTQLLIAQKEEAKAQLKQQSLYNGNLLLEEHDPPTVYDSEETLELAQESREKMRFLKKEINLSNSAKINHLSGVFIPQTTKYKEELFLSNVSNMVTVFKTISIPNEDLSDDTTPKEFDFMAVAGDLDEIEEVDANCILMANLQHASTSGTQLDKAPTYDTDGSAEVVQICLWCVESGCSKHMTGNIKLLINFMWKFLGTVRFGNEHIDAILGYGDLKWGNITITRVYFVKGLCHNLFLVDQFCDADLDVAFRRNTCFIKDLDGVDLLKGNCFSNLYTINLYDMASASPICLMARATPTKSWLWHQRLSHLNIDTINDLAKNDLVSGLPKFKYAKEHLCPSCEQGKRKKASHPPKPVSNSKPRLHLLHMDLCGPMRVASIKGKRYVLVIVDDHSRYTWVYFLTTKDETPEVIKNFLKKISVRLQAPVIIVRTDNETEFKNHVLKEYFNSVGITHETSAAKTPQQNGFVECRNRRLVEAARTMLIFSHASLFLWAEAIATAWTSVTPHVDKPKISVVTPHSKKSHASIPSHSVPQPKEFHVVKHRNVLAFGMFKINPSQTSKVVQICLWCVDSGCSKHMTGNIKLLINFMWKFLGTVCFGNDHIDAILGFGDLKWGNITITRVYFVKGLCHNLFLVDQFCDADLDVAFRRNTCFIRDLDGVDLLKGNCFQISTPSISMTWPQLLPYVSWPVQLLLSRGYGINDYPTSTLTPSTTLLKMISSLVYQSLNMPKNISVPLMSKEKEKKASHPPKPVSNSKPRLHLLHMDLCGPMRVASIKGKRYVLVIVDDHSRYTWVHFLTTKDETPEVIKNFLKKISVRLQAPVIIVRTDNETVFKNYVLKEYFNSVGITHETFAAKTPQQNGFVECRNRRTMLIFSHVSLFLWAEAIATACYTQNRSIIHQHFNKTPYELIQGRKLNISYLHVFRALCYSKNDHKDIDKLGATGDIGFFIGYSANSIAYRVYNRRTKKIMEMMNVSFDELSVMDFEQNSSRPGLQSMTSGQISFELELTYAPSTITPQRPSERDLDILFEPLHNEYLGDSVPALTNSLNTPVSSHNVDEPSQQHAHQQRNITPSPTASAADNVSNVVFEGDLFVNPFATPSTESVVSSTQYVDPSNMHTFFQPYPHDYQWTKDHPLEQVIEEPSRPVLTRNQLKTDGDMCIYALTVSIMEPKSVKEALTNPAWIESMQEELHQFIRLDV
nr:putative ribonuclease H-like domain-containing protein [Tanacetum cinerariifolium]